MNSSCFVKTLFPFESPRDSCSLAYCSIVHVETTVHRHCHQTAGCAAHSQSSQLWRTISLTKYWLPGYQADHEQPDIVSSTAVTCSWHYSENFMQNIEMYRSQNLQNAYALADTINAWRRSNFRFQSTAVDYRGIIADKSSITAVTPQQLTPSPRYYRNVHRKKPRYYRRPHYRAAL